ncbi:f5944a25-8495-4b08-baad-212b7d114a82 [Sclerotinia trifoliorum]|uniref:F5944a25-8495-4b08-baad-212b7d114a82 n=1 Tax=Sclerotinia trifoliorum TaxID=28548 RepID=A0A8H2ZN94_9HELO|nr:f5944a25-8495-4b08-baad-212b7d114a82 [Sclerotinia trifoliorum]
MAYLPYVEPGLEIILPLSTFIFILNITRDILDNFLYCGLIGEIFIETIQYLGYLGLICLVFEGGLITDLKMLGETIWVTLSAAAMGILMPMALSFSIMGMKFDTVEGSGYPTALAAFSAGVSLCSTSLGSTFIILSSANLQKTPTGTLIAGAAMIDDILVLVMVKIVTALGQGQSNPWRIARPAISSLSLILATFLLVPFLIKPIYKTFHSILKNQKEVNRGTFSESYDTERGISRRIGFILSTLILILLVTIAACIEGSILLSAFLAGAIVRYTWRSVDLDLEIDMDMEIDRPTLMFEEYYKPIMDHILVPFFFASIGFSIPISEMFSSSIIYKGIFYALLMFFAKASVGLILYMNFLVQKFTTRKSPPSQIQIQIQHPESQPSVAQHETGTSNTSTQFPPRLPHLDALIVGSTMIARGGFGFLVASEAQSSGLLSLYRSHGLQFKDSGRIDVQGLVREGDFRRQVERLDVVEDQIFLVIIWALVLCTILGPVVAGVAVRRKVLFGSGAGCACACGRGRGAEGRCHLCL